MSKSLPLRANLEWLKKAAKDRFNAMRAEDPGVQLSDAQLALARDYGYPSWPKLKVHVELIQQKLAAFEASANPNPQHVAPDDPELAQLLAAIRAGDAKTLSDLLTNRRELAKAKTADGLTPLHAAAEYDDPRFCAFLLACGADPNATYGDSAHTPLSWAVTCNAHHAAAALVKLGIKADLFCAAGMGDLDAVRAFFDDTGALRAELATGSSRTNPEGKRLPCPPTSAIEQISDALYIAARNRHADVVRFLLTKNPDLSFRAYLGGTPLHWAHFAGSPECIQLLTSAGADPNSRDTTFNATPRAFGILVPASWGFIEFVQYRLTSDPALSNLVDGGTTALHEAARYGHSSVVRLLLDSGANPTLHNADGKTPADLAAHLAHSQIVSLLNGATPRT